MNSAEEFCRYLGVDYETTGGLTRIVCPFHDDHHPSMVVYPEMKRGAYCFSCAENVSWAWLAAQVKGIPYAQARTELGLPVTPQSKAERLVRPPAPRNFCPPPSPEQTAFFNKRFALCSDDYPEPMVRWLESKKLLEPAREIGWKYYPKCAVTHSKPVFGRCDGKVVIPYHFGSDVAYTRSRELTGPISDGRCTITKPKGPMNVGIQPYFDTFRPNDVVYVCEGECDSLSIWAHGGSAIGIPGACAKKAINTVVAFLKDTPYIKEVVVCGDKDTAGEKMVRLVQQTCVLMGLRALVRPFQVKSEGDGADVNDDHKNGLLKLPTAHTCWHKNNYKRNFDQDDFSDFVDKIDDYTARCEAKGINPWQKVGNVEVLPVVEQLNKKIVQP